MAENIPTDEMYEKISEWLNLYHSNISISEKERVKTLIVTQMYPVIKHIAKTIARRSYDPIEDMVQAGFIGLLKAIDKYDASKNDNFRVYAGYLIIGEMKHYLRDKLNTIKVPRHIQELSVRIYNFTQNLTIEEVQTLTSEEIATSLEVSQKAVDAAMLMERRRTTISLEEVYRADKNHLNYEEMLASGDFEEESAYEDARIIFEDAIKKLPYEQKCLIDMYYKKGMTQREIAKFLSLSQMGVSRKLKRTFELIAQIVVENRFAYEDDSVKKNEDED